MIQTHAYIAPSRNQHPADGRWGSALLGPLQHSYMVFDDDYLEHKQHCLQLFPPRIGFQQVALLQNLTTVRIVVGMNSCCVPNLFFGITSLLWVSGMA
jgi:hypothetical protein